MAYIKTGYGNHENNYEYNSRLRSYKIRYVLLGLESDILELECFNLGIYNRAGY